MFEVRTASPFDGRWERRDEEIVAAAGRQSDFSGCLVAGDPNQARDHGWVVGDFAEAAAMKGRLAAVEGVTATVRER